MSAYLIVGNCECRGNRIRSFHLHYFKYTVFLWLFTKLLHWVWKWCSTHERSNTGFNSDACFIHLQRSREPEPKPHCCHHITAEPLDVLPDKSTTQSFWTCLCYSFLTYIKEGKVQAFKQHTKLQSEGRRTHLQPKDYYCYQMSIFTRATWYVSFTVFSCMFVKKDLQIILLKF